jgi:hypothetical protein
MAELPRYKSSGLQVAVPEGQFRDVSAPMDALSKGMNQMTSFFMQSAQEQAVVEGERYGAENAPTVEQLSEAYKTGEALKPVGDTFTIFGQAAQKASQDITRTNVYYASHTEMSKVSEEIESGRISPDSGMKQFNAIIKGFSGALSDIDPVASKKMSAELAYKANTQYLAATKKAASNAVTQAKIATAQEIDLRLSSLPQIIAAGDRYDPTSGKITSVTDLVKLEQDRVIELGGKISLAQREVVKKAFNEKFIDSRNDYVSNIMLSQSGEEDRNTVISALADFKLGKSTGNSTLDTLLRTYEPDEFNGMLKEVREISNQARADEDNRIKFEQGKLEAQLNPVREDFLFRLTQMENGDLSSSLTAQEIASSKLPAFGPGSKDTFYGLLKSATSSEKAKEDPLVLLAARTAIANGEITDTKQLEPYIQQGYLTAGNVNTLFNDLNSPDKLELKRKTEFLNLAKNRIAQPDPQFGIPDPEGLTSYNAFLYAFEKEYDKKIKEGFTQEQLLDPSNKDSLFPLIKYYQRSIEEIISGTAKKIQSQSDPTLGSSEKPKIILTEEEYNVLKSGEYFIDPTGKKRVKN